MSTLSHDASLAPLAPGNPGQHTPVRVAFSDGTRSWSEELDLLGTLARVVAISEVKVQRGSDWLMLNDRLLLRPRLVAIEPQDDGSVNTVTTVDINHPSLCASGTFEYQHGAAATAGEAFEQALTGWAASDLPVFLHALDPNSELCTTMHLELPAAGTTPARSRQVVLGQPLHCAQHEAVASDEPHDFCPCCLLTNCWDAFREHLAGTEFFGIRLFALRDASGGVQADCRINGIDWEIGREALLAYAASWPDRGFEYRKQYVIIPIEQA